MLVHFLRTVLQQEAKEEPVYSTVYGCIYDAKDLLAAILLGWLSCS